MLKTDVAAGPQYHIRVFRTGECTILGRFSYRNYARERDHVFTLYVSIIQGNGITALVDTGLESVPEMNRGAGFLMSREIEQAPDEDTETILRRAGVAGAAVDYVLLTHCHYDHCSRLALFPNARVVVPERAWRVWHDQSDGANYLHQGFLAELQDLRAAGRLLLLDEGLIAPGIGVRWVGGHSPCSQFVYVNTSQGVAVFTGDTVQMYGNVEHDDTVGIWVDESQCRQALAIAQTEPDILLPGHEPRILDRYRDGIVA